MQGVRPGEGKSIIWNAGDIYQNISPELFQVRLLLVQVVGSASSATAPHDLVAEATQEAGQEEMENRFEMDKAKDLPLSILGRDGAPMILIAPGYFTMGSSKKDGNKDEHPSHRVWISSYYIDGRGDGRTLAMEELLPGTGSGSYCH